LNWKEHYSKFSSFSTARKKIGIKDWEKRFLVIFNWLEKYGVSKKSKILDCGCNIGVLGLLLKENNFKNIVGIDIDPKILKISKKILKTYKMDCHDLKFKNNEFDVFIALNIIEHLDEPKRFLNEAKRVTKKGGFVILSTPNTNFIRKTLKKVDKSPGHINFWSFRQFKNLLKMNGLNVIEKKGIGRFPTIIFCQTFMVLCRNK
jgi:2-polyprenyl-3-methyl-5-hydroxy-6-metoxy-1,4-benzoquinol methylase